MVRLEIKDRITHPNSAFGLRRQVRRLQEFGNINSDSSIAPNCLGYALYTLGLTKEERFIHTDSVTQIINRLFEKVNTPEEADAIAFISRLGRKIDVDHIGLINKTDPTNVIQRARVGENISTIQLETLISDYMSIKLYPPRELVYIKLKDRVKKRLEQSKKI